MKAIKQAPSPVGEWTANVVGIDPHKRTLTATVVDGRGGIVASEHFRVSGDGHRALAAWARSFGPIARWGIEGASGWGRHTAVFLAGREQDVRDVCATRTARSDRARQRGKSDTLDSGGSRVRHSRTRCCHARSSAPAATVAPTSSRSCWRCGTTRAARS